MLKEKVSQQEAVDFLNDILKADPEGISAFFSTRVACNKELANHPTVQVGVLNPDYHVFGALGILNGLFGIDEDGWGCIVAIVEGPKIIQFEVVTNKHKGQGKV